MNISLKFRTMVGGGIGKFPKRSVRRISLDGKKEEHWREASSAIIVAPMNNAPPYSLGYLMVERSKLLGASPGGTVFPGGVVSAKVDFSLDWLGLYKDAKIDLRTLQFFRKEAHQPEIYKESQALIAEKEKLPKWVGLRLAAIRETFEETGILLCKRTSSLTHSASSSSTGESGESDYEYEELLERKVVHDWQGKIRENPMEFISLCLQLKCLPDLTLLREWSNWLTPTVVKPKERFDTMFYMVLLTKMPRVVYDSKEVASAKWASAAVLLKEYHEKKLKLMIPQLYELTRLETLENLQEFEERLNTRSEKGLERLFPFVQEAKDGKLILFPGDDNYPEHLEATSQTKIPKINRTLEDLRKEAANLHRAEQSKNGAYKSVINVKRLGHWH